MVPIDSRKLVLFSKVNAIRKIIFLLLLKKMAIEPHMGLVRAGSGQSGRLIGRLGRRNNPLD